MRAANMTNALIKSWFAERGWEMAPFQIAARKAWLDGCSGLIHSPTGSGKSLAAWLGPMSAALDGDLSVGGLRVLWITPLRALARDTCGQLQTITRSMGLDWRIEARTGDTSGSQRARQRKRLPEALVTTPESLELLLSYRDACKQFSGLEAVVVDEWHELLGSKRGVMLELALSWLRARVPGLRVWGLSATLGNLQKAREVLLGPGVPGVIVAGPPSRPVNIRALLPQNMERFPWAGHLGTRLVPEVVGYLEQAGSTLLFTNTRSQAEIWFEALSKARLDWIGQFGLHHGSIDRRLRETIEEGLRVGDFRCVVCTSSLDLGVDFSPVDRVAQVGSPKGVARLLQRAGRCGHRPGAESEILCVPTHAFELIEVAAARRAWRNGEVEERVPLRMCLDVLIQHMVTLACGDGFDPDDLYREVCRTHAFERLDKQQWRWCLNFILQGGAVLEHYPEFRRVIHVDGRCRIATDTLARRHRMAIGTLSSDQMMSVRYQRGGHIGLIEESFVARLSPGDVFLLAGKALELIRVRDMGVQVRQAQGARRVVPRWQGGRLPLSGMLSAMVRTLLGELRDGRYADPETAHLRDILDIQRRWSAIPGPGELLIERSHSREGVHLFVFPFAGRQVHEGLAAVLAWRLGQRSPATFSISINDYGIELLTAQLPELSQQDWRDLLSAEHLLDDILSALNTSEMARRQFRDIARIAGLVFPGFPGQGKSAKQLQASSGLLYDTLKAYDPEHLLLAQAREEILSQQLDFSRLQQLVVQLATQSILCFQTERFSPLAFPLWVERQRSRLSTENWEQRVARMLSSLERAAQ